VDDVSTRASDRVLAERYVLLERLGTGGAGVVWRGHDQLLDRTVAVKLLHRDLADDPATTERFHAEAAAAAKLTHPHAVIVYDIGETDDGDYLVMEFVDGATLADLLDAGPLPPGVAAALGQQVGRALGAAHRRGLVHRDVKPANILVTTEGIAKVADFGIARALGDATSRLTTAGHVMGTARYLSPEQLRDDPVDGRADVYALGLVLHQCLTGRAPFGEGTAVEVASRRLVADLPPPSESRDDIPPALDDAIVRATLLDPEHRFADGAAFAAALGSVAAPYAPKELAARTRRARGDASAGGATRTHASTPVQGSPPVRGPAEAQETTAIRPTAPARSGAPKRRNDQQPRRTQVGGRAAEASPQPAPDEATSPGRPTGGRWLWLAAAVLLVLAVIVTLGLAEDDQPTGDEGAPDEPTTIQVVDGSDHDPFGGGEHPDRVPEAFDDNPDTYWRTQQYRGNPELGGLKPGVGIWLDLGDPATVSALVVSTTNPGASFTVYVGDAPPGGGDAPEDWGRPVADVSDASGEQRVELEEATEGRIWLLWFTSLPPDGGNFRATVSDVRFEAG
jgi:eukaryotic-like serine/threonine-protein kinase